MNGEDRIDNPGSDNRAGMTKSDAYTEIYLWNLNVDRLTRVLERLALQSICPKQELKAYGLRLEEIRPGLNAGSPKR